MYVFLAYRVYTMGDVYCRGDLFNALLALAGS